MTSLHNLGNELVRRSFRWHPRFLVCLGLVVALGTILWVRAARHRELKLFNEIDCSSSGNHWRCLPPDAMTEAIALYIRSYGPDTMWHNQDRYQRAILVRDAVESVRALKQADPASTALLERARSLIADEHLCTNCRHELELHFARHCFAIYRAAFIASAAANVRQSHLDALAGLVSRSVPLEEGTIQTARIVISGVPSLVHTLVAVPDEMMPSFEALLRERGLIPLRSTIADQLGIAVTLKVTAAVEKTSFGPVARYMQAGADPLRPGGMSERRERTRVILSIVRGGTVAWLGEATGTDDPLPELWTSTLHQSQRRALEQARMELSRGLDSLRLQVPFSPIRPCYADAAALVGDRDAFDSVPGSSVLRLYGKISEMQRW